MYPAIIVLLLALAFIPQTAAQAADSPIQMCQDPLLSRYEQTLCREQILGAKDTSRLREVQKKFRDRIRIAQDALKVKEKK